jgi:hypothetical protein
VVLALLGLSLLTLIGEVRPLIALPTTSAILVNVSRLGLTAAVVGWYLLRASVRDAFRQRSQGDSRIAHSFELLRSLMKHCPRAAGHVGAAFRFRLYNQL